MKNLTFILAVLLFLPAIAQKKIDKTIAFSSGKTIFLNLKYASDIKIKTWQKNEIAISVSVNINNNTDNEEFILESTATSSEIQIKSDIPNLKKIAKEPIKGSTQKQLYDGDNYGYWDKENKVYINTGKQILADIDYEIFVPATADVRIKTIGGNVKMEGETGKYDIESSSGKIDLTLSENQKRSLVLKTITGEIYANLPLQLAEETKKDNLDLVGGGKFNQNLKAKINGGGTEIRLTTISNNIYLRKK